MWEWMTNNKDAINLGVNVAMLVVWIAYLQVFWIGFRRQNRAVVHISTIRESDGTRRCLVSNMGADLIYILGVKVDVWCGDRRMSAVILDRTEEDEEVPDGDIHARTHQGPLRGGEVKQIGRLTTLCRHALTAEGEGTSLENCERVEITVVVAARQAHLLMGGHKTYDITHPEQGSTQFAPAQVLTHQLTSRRRRKEFTELVRR
ncbi:hypothetical protein [Sagittula sp. SSi028]|uniref:hypothetical protein n=1 Tax=Sagittula sp. SSi028 TaxID=3400636 RepID=UPI003AF89571